MATKKILIADDNADIRKVIKAALSRKEYRIVEAEDGTAAIRKLHAEKFDLLITDYDMPGANGLEVMKAARSLHPKMPMMLVSANLPSEVQSATEGLADYIIEKPFEISNLVSTVSRLLR